MPAQLITPSAARSGDPEGGKALGRARVPVRLRDVVFAVGLGFYAILLCFLSINWTSRTINPLVLSWGVVPVLLVLVLSAMFGPRNYTWACLACGRTARLPGDAAFCPFCGKRWV